MPVTVAVSDSAFGAGSVDAVVAAVVGAASPGGTACSVVAAGCSAFEVGTTVRPSAARQQAVMAEWKVRGIAVSDRSALACESTVIGLPLDRCDPSSSYRPMDRPAPLIGESRFRASL